MTDIIDGLRNDHKNIGKLLDLLDQQTAHLEAAEYADYHLIANIMHYFVNFPDIYHHPYEDLLFDALKNKEINTAGIIDEIYSEHQTMATDSSKILDEIKQLQGDAIFSRDDFVSRLTDYISIYRSHIDKEERDLFSLAETALDEEAWRKINVAIHAVNDPLFGKIRKDEYQELFKTILAEVVEE